MGNAFNTDSPVLWKLKHSWSPPPEYKPHPQLFFSGERGGNFELEFCKTTEDKFNGFMPCISRSVILHETTNIIDV